MSFSFKNQEGIFTCAPMVNSANNQIISYMCSPKTMEHFENLIDNNSSDWDDKTEKNEVEMERKIEEKEAEIERKIEENERDIEQKKEELERKANNL
jgi:hypothetical protein